MNTYLTSLLGTLVALAVIGSATYLATRGVINGEAIVGIYATLIGGGGAVVAHQAGVKAAK